VNSKKKNTKHPYTLNWTDLKVKKTEKYYFILNESKKKGVESSALKILP